MKKIYRVFSSVFLALLLVVAFAVPCFAAANAPAGFVDYPFSLESEADCVFNIDTGCNENFFLDDGSVVVLHCYLPAGTYFYNLNWTSESLALLDQGVDFAWSPVAAFLSNDCVSVQLNYDDRGCFVVPEEFCQNYLTEDDGYPDGEYCEVFLTLVCYDGMSDFLKVYDPSAAPEASGNVVSDILSVWSAIIRWFGGAFDRLTPLFYSAETGLTFVGFLAVGGLAVAAAFLLLSLVRKWLNFGT